jgi:hypothetical protein
MRRYGQLLTGGSQYSPVNYFTLGAIYPREKSRKPYPRRLFRADPFFLSPILPGELREILIVDLITPSIVKAEQPLLIVDTQSSTVKSEPPLLIPGSQTRSPTVAISDNSFGSSPWTDPANVLASDDAWASATAYPTHYLQASDFGFNIPDGATIDGIEISLEGFGVGFFGGTIIDHSIRIVKNGIYAGDELADGIWPPADFIRTFGGVADLLGETWTPAQINSANFGVGISASAVGFATGAFIDHIQITVHYTEVVPAPPVETVFLVVNSAQPLTIVDTNQIMVVELES